MGGSSSPVKVSVYEAGARIGTPIMRSGNGRCNFTNANLDIARYHGADFVAAAKAALEADPETPGVLEWFAQLGLVWAEPTADGLMYPLSNKANSVLDVMRLALDRLGVNVRTETYVQSIERNGSAFRLVLGGGVAERADAVVLAAGGTAGAENGVQVPCLEAHLRPHTPVLCALATERAVVRGMDGVRMQARASLPERGFAETGEVLFRDYGVSGIVIFNASRYARTGDRLVLDLLPQLSREQLIGYLNAAAQRGAASVEELGAGLVVAPVARAVGRMAQFGSKKRFSEADCAALADILKAFPLTVQGIANAKHAQVQRGGFDPAAFDPATMECKQVPGLYVLGEALDIDGPCGGYNLDWAWTSGILAGSALGRKA